MHRACSGGLQAGNDAGGGSAATGVARLLGYAAMPVFALMALWTALSGGQGDMLCLSMQGSWPMDGMATMYGLMSVFHAAPWLRLLGGR